jgi:hypothetical protein
MAPSAKTLVERLAGAETGEFVFNPWGQVDIEHGLGQEGPAVRRQQLTRYLEARQGRARWLLVGEALGYQGGHFTGMAMTSERILLGHMQARGIEPDDVLPGLRPRRTSRPDIKAKGFSEPTATIVWSAIKGFGFDPRAFVLWNAFPWHPFKPDVGRLSNRRPILSEVEQGAPLLNSLLDVLGDVEIMAVGRVAADMLDRLELQHGAMRHPARGGAPVFRAQLAALGEHRPA